MQFPPCHFLGYRVWELWWFWLLHILSAEQWLYLGYHHQGKGWTAPNYSNRAGLVTHRPSHVQILINFLNFHLISLLLSIV